MLPTTLATIASWLGQSHPSCERVQGVAVDSRLVKPGDLFFALPGAKQDGHQFVQEAFEKGAVGAVVQKACSEKCICVPDVLAALQQLAALFLQTVKPKIVAITGSLGKTTTKEFTTTLLKTKFYVASTVGNANSKVGIPLSLLNLKTKPEVLVIEMGMSEPGDISKMLSIVVPDIALITTVDLVHAVNFESLEQIAFEKGQIFSHPKTSFGLYNATMPFAQKVNQMGTCTKRSFSLYSKEADYFVERLGSFPWHIRGEHNLQNFLAAAAIGHTLGMSFKEIVQAAPLLRLPPMRLQEVEKRGILFINDAYNAAEKSMCAALASLPEPKQGGKKIAVFGDMRELGKFGKEAHKVVAEHALDCVDELICTGEGCLVMEEVWKKAGRHVTFCPTRELLIETVKARAQEGDVVLLKGSRVHSLNTLTEEFV